MRNGVSTITHYLVIQTASPLEGLAHRVQACHAFSRPRPSPGAIGTVGREVPECSCEPSDVAAALDNGGVAGGFGAAHTVRDDRCEPERHSLQHRVAKRLA